jgi:uncharacterized protein (DUF2236 family)
MIVTRRHLEASLERLAAELGDPRHGIHGPGSRSWLYNRELVNFLGAGRAALMQIALPHVAHAIDQHSDTRTDIQGRFKRTFANVFAMTFGDSEQAFAAARQVHTIHARINGVIAEDVGRYARGTPYRANDSTSLMWVHATLLETVIRVRRAAGDPIPRSERRRFYAEGKRFAALFGIPDSEQPKTYDEFADYFDEMVASDALAVGEPARDIGKFLLTAPTAALAPAMRWYRIITAGLLPARFREPFGLPYGPAERAVFASSMATCRAVYPALPRSIRLLPGYLQAMERCGIRPSAPWSRIAGRVAMTGLGVWPKIASRRPSS